MADLTYQQFQRGSSGKDVRASLTINGVQTTVSPKPTTDGTYIFAVVPSGGLPAGVALQDIAVLSGGVWLVLYAYKDAPPSVQVGSVGTMVWTKSAGKWVQGPVFGTSAMYMDVAGVRFQRGRYGVSAGAAGNFVQTLPVAFANVSYSICFGDSSTLALTKPLFFDTQTTTSFRVWYPALTEGHTFNWIAMGLAP